MDTGAKIYVAGHTGLVGSGLMRALERKGCANLVTRTHAELELTNQAAVEAVFQAERPQYVFLAAAMSGGIHRNATYPAEMIQVNLAIQCNVIDAARQAGVEKLLFIASACSYPRDCKQPIRPEALLTGPVEPTNEPFAVAKIAGIRMCQAYNAQYGTSFISVIPSTIYGPGDHFDENGHVVAALIARFHEAKRSGDEAVDVWGTGEPRREFLYVDDAADGLLFLMDHYNDPTLINLGAGTDIAIADLAALIADTVGFQGKITFDTTRPDGMLKRLLDSTTVRDMGWQPQISLSDGLARTYQWYLKQL